MVFIRWVNIGGGGGSAGAYEDGNGPAYSARSVFRFFYNAIQMATPDGETVVEFESPSPYATNCVAGVNILPEDPKLGGYTTWVQGPDRTPTSKPAKLGGYLVASWNGDITQLFPTMISDTEAAEFFNRFRTAVGRILSGIAGFNVGFNVGFGSSMQIRRPTWLTTGGNGGGNSQVVSWASLYDSVIDDYIRSMYHEDINYYGQQPFFLTFAGRVEKDTVNGLHPGGWCNMMTNTPAHQQAEFLNIKPVNLFGKYGGQYILDNPMAYNQLTSWPDPNDEYIPAHNIALFFGKKINKMMAATSSGMRNDPSKTDFIGRCGGQYICPINKEDIDALVDAKRLIGVNGLQSAIWDGTSESLPYG